MAKRKPISSSVRWSVFQRDGFCCRYCGVQAGAEGVSLTIDHLLPVAEGGDNRIDNLVSACSRCNGGKGAKVIDAIPVGDHVDENTRHRLRSLVETRARIAEEIQAQEDLDQEIINMKCRAYRSKSTVIVPGERVTALKLCTEFGAETLLHWYKIAAENRVPESRAIAYVCGCARRTREANAQ